MKNYFNNTSHQQILNFLANHPGRSFFDKEIRQATLLSAGATNKALRELSEEGYIEKEKKGRMHFYSVDISNPLIKQFKVLLNVTLIYPLIRKLEVRSKRIILFGSSAEGINTYESDIDLFVLTNETETVKETILKSELGKKIQFIIRTPNQFVKMEAKDKLFYEQVMRGLTLWEQKDES